MIRFDIKWGMCLAALAGILTWTQTSVLHTSAEEYFFEEGGADAGIEVLFGDEEYYEDEYFDDEYFEDEYYEDEEHNDLPYGIRLVEGFDGELYEEYYDLETGKILSEDELPSVEIRGKSDPEYGPDEFRARRTPEEGFVLRKNPKESKFKDFERYDKEDAEEYFHLVSYDQLPKIVDLDVPEVLQRPELPTGCESVSLTMALRYEGFDLLKTEIAAEFLLFNVDDENAAIGFIGDPFDDSGAGCYAPALAATANNFFIDQGHNYRGFDITGTELEDLLCYVAAGKPVMVWTTMFMEPVEFSEESGKYDGKEYKWYKSEHCVLLTGYNMKKGKLKINDPLDGIVYRDYDEFKKIYDEVGQMAVVVMNLDSRSFAAESDNTAAQSLGMMIESEATEKNSKKKKN